MLTNTNPGTVKHGVAYETISGITVKVYSTSKDLPSGTIEENERKYIRLWIKNTNSTSKTIKLSTILGYEIVIQYLQTKYMLMKEEQQYILEDQQHGLVT